MTRYEDIRNMTLERMAEWLAGSDMLCMQAGRQGCDQWGGDCILCAKQWLLTEKE